MTGVLAPAPLTAATGQPTAAVHRAAMLALARVEAVRLLRHPATVVALVLLLSIWTRWFVTGGNRFPILHDEDRGVQYLVLILLGGATLIGSNLAVLRAHRHRVTGTYDVLVLPPAWRIGGHLLAVLPMVLLTALLVTARTGLLMLPAGAVGRPNILELALSPLAVAFMGAAGVGLGRLIRSAVVAPVAVPLIAVATFVAALSDPSGLLPWLLPVAFIDPSMATSMPMPSQTLGRPAGAHLVYVAGLVGLIAVAAVGRRNRWSAAVVVAALTAVVAGGVVQSLPVDAAVKAARVTATKNPAPMQTCERRGQLTYCAFTEFIPWIDEWDRVVRGVLDRVPRAVADRPLAVRQRVVATGGSDESDPLYSLPAGGLSWGPEEVRALADAQERADAAAGTPHAVTVGTRWGGPRDEVTLAAFVAQRVLAGEDNWAGASCGSRSVLVAWLAGQVGPDTAAGLREIDKMSSGAVPFMGPHPFQMLMVDDREMAVAKALLRMPAAEVARKLAERWDDLAAADAPTERIAELFGVAVAAQEAGRKAMQCDS